MKSKSGRQAGAETRTVYTQGPPRQWQTPIYYGKSPLKMAPQRTNNSGIEVSRKGHTIGAPRK